MRVVVLSSTRWESPWLSKQHLAAALASRGDSVLYVDPPVSPLSPIRQPERWADLLRRGPRASAGVEVRTPLALPGQHRRIVQSVNAAWAQRTTGAWTRVADLTVAFGLQSRALYARSGGLRVYHCTDSWADHPGLDAASVIRWEDEILASSDVVVACSRPLVEMLRGRGVEAHLLPHGVDVDAFDGAASDPEISSLPGPRIGFAGGLNFRLDPALLLAALEAVPGGTLVLIGSAWRSAGGAVDPSVEELLRREDVRSIGHRSGPDFANALAALDVALVPYRTTAFNRRSYPLKIPQYLAVGLPVVSTPNGATDEYGTLLSVAEEAEEFAEAVAAAVREPGSPQPRRDAAAQRPWSVVATELVELTGLERGPVP